MIVGYMKILKCSSLFFLCFLITNLCFAKDDALNFSMENVEEDEKYTESKADLDGSLSMLKINDISTSYNRHVYKFTSAFIQEGLSPIIIFYKNNVPRTVNDAIVNFVLNTRELNYAVNHVLQANPIDFGISVTRFVINSTIGVLGLLDVSDMIGIPRQITSMDDTLESWGVGEGNFVMMPLLGGGTIRSFTGDVIDIFADPFTWFVLPSIIPNRKTRFIVIMSKSFIYGFTVVADRYSLLVEMEKASLDPYTTFRNYFLQNKYYQLMQKHNRRSQNRDHIIGQFLSDEKENGYNQLSINENTEKHYSGESIQNPLNFSMEENI